MMRSKNIFTRLSFYMYFVGVGLTAILLTFTTTLLISRTQSAQEMAYEERLQTKRTEFDSYIMRIETTVDAVVYFTRDNIKDEDINQIEMDEMKAHIESVFFDFLNKEDSVTNSIYLYFDPNLTGTANDVWLLKEGNQISKQDEIPLSRYISEDNMTWFYGPKESKESGWVHPFVNQFDEYVTSYVTPIYYNNRFIGVAGAYLDLNILDELLHDNLLAEDEMFWVVDENNEVVYHPIVEKGTIIDIDVENLPIKETLLTSDTINNWTFAYSNTNQTAVLKTFEQIAIIIVSTVISFLLFYTVATLYSRKYIQRMNRIFDSVTAIGYGDYKVEINDNGSDEVKKIADEIDKARVHLSEKMEDLRITAYTDSVTKLPNHNQLINDLSRRIIEHPNEMFTIYYIRYRLLRNINDLLGYEFGNYFLEHTTGILQDVLSEHSTIYHDHSDTFVIVEKTTNYPEQARTLQSKIVRKYRDNIKLGEINFSVEPRIGTCQYPIHETEPTRIIRGAELACNNTKPFKVQSYLRSYLKDLHVKTELSAAFKKALNNNEFEVYYQPIMNIETEKVSSFEALIRWNHPEKGVLTPEYFLDYAEQSGLIIDVGSFVLKEVCKQVKDWEFRGLKTRVSVNVSSKQLLENAFVRDYRTILRKFQVDPASIELEITEHIIIEDKKHSIQKLTEIQKTGSSIVLDDFGTGFSSLNYIRELPLSKMKIDKDFVKNITKSEKDIRILKSIVEMAKTLGLEVIIEGIETEGQLNKIKEINCRYVQGYYFYYPLRSIQVTEEFLNQRGSENHEE